MNRYSMKSDSAVAEINEFCGKDLLGKTRFSNTNVEYIKNELAEIFYDSIKDFINCADISQIRCFIDDFFKYIQTIPASLLNKSGSTSLVGILPVYLLARSINPRMIIESGVFIGSSLHMFSHVFKDLPVYAFDINLNKLLFQSEHTFVYEMDWTEYADLPRVSNSLVFFDDHINCAKRILESHQRGIRWAIFDDSPTIGHLAQYRYPAVPSIPMILDEKLPDKCIFEWHHLSTDTKLSYQHNLSECLAARKVIDKAVCLDVLSSVTGISCGDKWAVELSTI